MLNRAWLPGLLLVMAAFLPPGVAVRAQDGGVALSVAPEVLSPGDVGLVTVRGTHPLQSPEGEAFGSPIRFWPGADTTIWRGLIGVDLETAPGMHEVSVRAHGADGVLWQARTTLEVQRKAFATRNLRVAERFVDPPPEEAARIAREAEELAGVFTRSAPERLWQGAFSRPVPGQATSSFGRLTVMNGTPRGRHRGADLRAATGDPVRAPNAGRVVLARDLYFTGHTVVVDHGLGLFSLFAHLSRVHTAEGALVQRDELLGDAGATGRVTGPHLHWTVRIGDVSVDPMTLMRVAGSVSEP